MAMQQAGRRTIDKFLVWESEEALSGMGWALADLMTQRNLFSLSNTCVCVWGGAGYIPEWRSDDNF